MENDYQDINPEIYQASPWLREVMNGADTLMNTGIDAATAAVIVAMVPITLRILKIVGDAVNVGLADTKEANAIKRERERDEQRLDIKRKEYELDKEFGRK